jgi:hypothetical protein
VLRGLDVDRHAPPFPLVEIHNMPAGREAIEQLLGERYITIEQLSPTDIVVRRLDAKVDRGL